MIRRPSARLPNAQPLWMYRLRLLATVALIGFAPACSAPSLLITPVSGRRDLVETELSTDSWLAMNKIALIDLSGVIANAERSPWFGSGGEHPVSLLLEQLDAARTDPMVKAVVLRINSPGGTVVASELMHQEIAHFRKTSGKPVVAMLMDVAASGGYYVACACDEIIAQPSTVTGSIGVIMQMVDVTGTMNFIGVKTDAITSGNFKDAGSPLRTMKPEERQLFQNMVNDMYDRFVTVVREGRPRLDEATVRKLADGRVYTAKQALEAGLIDRIATMREGIDRAKERASLKKVRLVTYMRSYDYRPNYYAASPSPAPGASIDLLKLNPAAWLESSTPKFMYLWRP